MKGTITWIPVDIEKPPPRKDSEWGYSKDVLVVKGKKVEIGRYCHGLNGGEAHWYSHFEPTHWAYINLPRDK